MPAAQSGQPAAEPAIYGPFDLAQIARLIRSIGNLTNKKPDIQKHMIRIIPFLTCDKAKMLHENKPALGWKYAEQVLRILTLAPSYSASLLTVLKHRGPARDFNITTATFDASIRYQFTDSGRKTLRAQFFDRKSGVSVLLQYGPGLPPHTAAVMRRDTKINFGTHWFPDWRLQHIIGADEEVFIDGWVGYRTIAEAWTMAGLITEPETEDEDSENEDEESENEEADAENGEDDSQDDSDDGEDSADEDEYDRIRLILDRPPAPIVSSSPEMVWLNELEGMSGSSRESGSTTLYAESWTPQP